MSIEQLRNMCVQQSSMQNQLIQLGQSQSLGQQQMGSIVKYNPTGGAGEIYFSGSNNNNIERKPDPTLKKLKETNMVTEVVQDAKKFIKDHKSTIYVVAILLVVDHFMFNGAMKEKLKAIMQNLIGKVEAKLNEAEVK